jgi:hypothetical protein
VLCHIGWILSAAYSITRPYAKRDLYTFLMGEVRCSRPIDTSSTRSLSLHPMFSKNNIKRPLALARLILYYLNVDSFFNRTGIKFKIQEEVW